MPPFATRFRRVTSLLVSACLLVLALALILWWWADHRHGIRWAQRVVRDRFPDVPSLTPSELAAWLADPHRPPPVILDARSAEEQAVSTLPQARCVHPETDFDALVASLPAEQPIVVYCAAGYRGARLARRLINAGLTPVHNLDGGIFAWANEGHPITAAKAPAEGVHPYHPLFRRLLKNPSSNPGQPPRDQH